MSQSSLPQNYTRSRKRRPGPPRRGRVIDKDFVAFAMSKGCTLKRARIPHECLGPKTFHHVRFCGSPKDDRSGFCLCAFGHLHTFNSKTSIEALGKEKWELYWGLSIEREIKNLHTEFRKSLDTISSTFPA